MASYVKPSAAWIVAISMLCTALVPLYAGTYTVSFVFTLLIAFILAQSWDWIGGQMGYINLGHYAFYGIGAYATAILMVGGVSFPVAFGLAAVAPLIAALVVGVPLFRLKGDYFAFATLSILPLCQILAYNLDFITHGANGIPLPPNYVLYPAYYLAIAVSIVAFVLTIVLVRSRFGFALRAIRNDEQAAAMSGINLLPTKLAVLTLSSVFAGFAGAIQTWQIGYLDPTTAFGLEVGLVPIAMVLLGGSGLLLGPFFGVLVLGSAHHFLLVRLPVLQTAVYGAVILLVGRFLPRGLLSLFSPPDRQSATDRSAEVSISDTVELPLEKSESTYRGDTPVFACENLTMEFGGNKALSGLTLQVRKAEIVGLVGPNGSGKTTLFNCLTKVFEPTAGTMFFEGHALTGLRTDQISRFGVGRTYQIPRPYSDLTVEENVVIPMLFREKGIGVTEARRQAYSFLSFAGLENKRNARADTLSLQEKKLLEFARALACKPKLLLVDEVASGLTPTEIRHFVGLLRKIRDDFGITIIWVEHIFWALAEVVDRLIVLENGSVLADGPLHELMRDERVLDAYLGRDEMEVSYANG